MDDQDRFNGIESLDHPVLAVRDLEQSRSSWERLGFTVPPRGSHVEWGTGNLCIMFPEDYVEMRGIVNASRFVMNLDRHLEQYGEGLMGVAFRSENILSSFESMTRHGLRIDRVRHLTRNFEHPEGWTQPSFELCAPDPADVEGLMHVIVLEHLTPELLRRPEFLAHPNGSTGVTAIAGVIHDAASVMTKMTALLGPDAVRGDADGVYLRLPTGQRIELLLTEPYLARFGEIGESPGPETPRLGAMSLRVEDLTTLRSVLDAGDVDYAWTSEGEIRVAPGYANGVTLDFSDADPDA